MHSFRLSSRLQGERAAGAGCTDRDRTEETPSRGEGAEREILEAYQGQSVVRYPAPKSQQDRREQYEWRLLEEALEATEGEYGSVQLKPTPHSINRNNEEEIMLRDDGRIHVLRKATSREMEKRLLPVRVPLLKGTLGYRVMITTRKKRDSLQGLTGGELRRIPLLQGTNWNDTPILRSNGFTVVEGPYYEGLFPMIHKGRYHFFPRAVHEAPAELEARRNRYPRLVLEPHILLHYPFYEYFFVSPGNTQLADRIRRGLMELVESGRRDELFEEYIAPSLRLSRIKGRRVISLHNEFLPEIPLADDPRFRLEIDKF